MSREDDPSGDRMRGACDGVGDQDMVICAFVTRYVCGRLIEIVASAGTPRWEGVAPLVRVFP